jgi:hypothetical protein
MLFSAATHSSGSAIRHSSREFELPSRDGIVATEKTEQPFLRVVSVSGA